MSPADKVFSLFLALVVGIFIWGMTLLFHYNHIYKVNTDGIATSVYSDIDYEIGDNINYQSVESGNIEGHNPTWGIDKQGTITKVLR